MNDIYVYRYRDIPFFRRFLHKLSRKKKKKRRAWGERSFSMEVRELKKQIGNNGIAVIGNIRANLRRT